MDFNSLLNKHVSIWGVGGYIYIDKDNQVRTSQYITDGKQGGPEGRKGGMHFLVEQSPKHNGTRLIALKSCTGRYLSVSAYGDEATDSIAKTLSLHPALVEIGIVRMIIEYAVPSAAPGFCYSPVELQSGPASAHQTLMVEYQGDGKTNKVGLLTHNGTYLRSQLWEGTVGQSPHCRSDEQWFLQL